MSSGQLLPFAVLVSLVLHGVAWASIEPGSQRAPASPRKSELRFEVVSKPAAPPPEPVVQPPKPAPLPEPKRAVEPARPPAPVQDEQPPAATEAPPVDDTAGVSLTGVGASDFSLPAGGGSLRPESARVVPAPPAPARAPSSPARSSSGPVVVALADLSSRPAPPALGALLERNYPNEARRRGLSGSAKVKARVDADGVVRKVTLIEESGSGFGTACSRTLTGSRWSPPRDRSGRSVATEIRYTCRFVVAP